MSGKMTMRSDDGYRAHNPSRDVFALEPGHDVLMTLS